MKKIVVLLGVTIIVINSYSQSQFNTYDRYTEMLDTLLVTFSNFIEKDLEKEGYSIPKRTLWNIEFVGSCFIMEVFFDHKRSNIISLTGTTGSRYDRFFKQNKGFRFLQRAYFEAFRREIQNNYKLPNGIVDHFSFKFLTLYNESPRHHAIYGEYLFKVDDDEVFEISEKKIEVLQSRDEIMRKYKLEF